MWTLTLDGAVEPFWTGHDVAERDKLLTAVKAQDRVVIVGFVLKKGKVRCVSVTDSTDSPCDAEVDGEIEC